MASFVLSFFPLDVLDGIWDLIESVSEGFLTYSFMGYERIKVKIFLARKGILKSKNVTLSVCVPFSVGTK